MEPEEVVDKDLASAIICVIVRLRVAGEDGIANDDVYPAKTNELRTCRDRYELDEVKEGWTKRQMV